MAKRIKQVTLDEEIIELLREEPNTSALINKLLKDYYGTGEDMKRAELTRKITEIEQEISEKQRTLKSFKKSLEKLEYDKQKIIEMFKDIPQSIVEDFSKFELTKESLYVRYQNIYYKTRLPFEKIYEAWLKYKQFLVED